MCEHQMELRTHDQSRAKREKCTVSTSTEALIYLIPLSGLDGLSYLTFARSIASNTAEVPQDTY